ncbi:MAG: hypothetical protein ACLP6E_18720, partial [Acidimicrobiales bacterium]
GNTATVVGRESDGSLMLDAGGSTLTLGAGLCSQLYVSSGASERPNDEATSPPAPTEMAV